MDNGQRTTVDSFLFPSFFLFMACAPYFVLFSSIHRCCCIICFSFLPKPAAPSVWREVLKWLVRAHFGQHPRVLSYVTVRTREAMPFFVDLVQSLRGGTKPCCCCCCVRCAGWRLPPPSWKWTSTPKTRFVGCGDDHWCCCCRRRRSQSPNTVLIKNQSIFSSKITTYSFPVGVSILFFSFFLSSFFFSLLFPARKKNQPQHQNYISYHVCHEAWRTTWIRPLW